MGCENSGDSMTIKLSKTLYDSYHTADMELILLYTYLDKVKDGEMELDFKIIDLIRELDLL